ncbi:MAG: hypothetical protein Q4P78_04855 [Rothia sp. (in: high G+C Gram-positive bacteria)]|uniref:hypothetical protein n=1 Tax=Rothia sp. (in: high G+C Gram-positive bacteria) TaxID=1885016 RepID=UPI0026E03F3D|nr:hypothetical protein [Rothia sp. (in: high G+C Gram-positive bacteria)]MDO5750516.1 hypothetical protein [Rothia sp. (in: high G+C Gram-positive bacteria)]
MALILSPRKRALKLQAMDKHDMAHYVSAYTYGNFLILAALTGLHDIHEVVDGNAWVIVAGTGLCTYIAHIIAELMEYRVTHEGKPTRDYIRHAAANASPILTTTALPTIILLLATGDPHDMIDQEAAYVVLAICYLMIVWRIFRLNFFINKYKKIKVTFRNFFSTLRTSILLTVMVVAIASLKVALTH